MVSSDLAICPSLPVSVPITSLIFSARSSTSENYGDISMKVLILVIESSYCSFM